MDEIALLGRGFINFVRNQHRNEVTGTFIGSKMIANPWGTGCSAKPVSRRLFRDAPTTTAVRQLTSGDDRLPVFEGAEIWDNRTIPVSASEWRVWVDAVEKVEN